MKPILQIFTCEDHGVTRAGAVTLSETAVDGYLFQPPAGAFDRRTFFLTIPRDIPKVGQYSGQLKRRFK